MGIGIGLRLVCGAASQAFRMFSFMSGFRLGDVLFSALYNIGWKPPPSPLPLPEGGMTKSLPISGSNSFGNLNGRPYEQHWSSSYAFWMGNWGKSFGDAGVTEAVHSKN